MVRKITLLPSAIMYWPIIRSVTQNPPLVRNCALGRQQLFNCCNSSVGPMFVGVAYTYLVVEIPTHLVKVEGDVEAR